MVHVSIAVSSTIGMSESIAEGRFLKSCAREVLLWGLLFILITYIYAMYEI